MVLDCGEKSMKHGKLRSSNNIVRYHLILISWTVFFWWARDTGKYQNKIDNVHTKETHAGHEVPLFGKWASQGFNIQERENFQSEFHPSLDNYQEVLIPYYKGNTGNTLKWNTESMLKDLVNYIWFISVWVQRSLKAFHRKSQHYGTSSSRSKSGGIGPARWKAAFLLLQP